MLFLIGVARINRKMTEATQYRQQSSDVCMWVDVSLWGSLLCRATSRNQDVRGSLFPGKYFLLPVQVHVLLSVAS